MKLSKIDRLLINDLFKSSEGLFLFTLYRRYNLSPKELFQTIEKLAEDKIVEIKDDRISLTKEGVEFAILKSSKEIAEGKKKELVHESFLGPSIEINSFYIPIGFEQ